VLLRAGEIVEGIDLARERRGSAKRDTELARGPARLTVALGITGADDGAALGGVNWVADTHGTARDRDRTRDRTRELDVSFERNPTPEDRPPPEPYSLELPPAPTTAFSTGPRTGVSGPGGDAATF